MNISVLKIIFLNLIILALCACGIDRGGIDVQQINPNPAIPTVVANGSAVVGKIESVDNNNKVIVINGDSLDLSAAAIIINGESAAVATLVAGMVAVATITAGGNSALPTRVQVDYNVAGGDIETNPAPDSISQLGQTIFVGNLNLPFALSDLATPGNTAAFSGFTTSVGVIDASAYVDYPNTAQQFVTGIAQDVDTSAFNFTLGGQTINYTQAISINTLSGMVDENSRIRVQVEPGETTGELAAISITEVSFIDAALGTNARISFSGYVSSIGMQDEFTASNISVSVSNNTTFNGVTFATLNLETQVLVKGVLTQDRKILAESVEKIN